MFKKLFGIISISYIVPYCYAASLASQSPMSELKGIFSGGERSYRDSRSHILELMQKAPASVEKATAPQAQLLDFLCLQSLSQWYEAQDHTKDEFFATGILSFAKLGSSVAVETVEEATGRKIGDLGLDDKGALTAIRDRVRPISPPTHELPHGMEAAVDQTHLVTEMIERLGDTIAVAKDPARDISLLPALNKYLLHEVARVLKAKKPEYNTLFTNTQALSEQYNQYRLDLAMKRINYAYQLGTKYSEYLTLDHIISLTTVWLVGYIFEQKGEAPIVASESVMSIMPHIMEAEEIAHGEDTELYGLLTQLDEKFGAA